MNHSAPREAIADMMFTLKRRPFTHTSGVNSVLKVEYIHRHAFATRTEARIRIATWITDFYNSRRLHSVCGFKSPIDYEHSYKANLTEELAA
ncbi:IS3 family transposase [Streptomyces sp. S3(2020)]|uniref:IS3 family transposase n=1 Tax=Streptomyces sp. S3(2020) TaxID=2732044 RepID=UPI0032173BD6